ncbi:MAG TPA: hypothetical protein PKM57_13335 [Kiritimatiellia bacterium]|nr:hypothetical protein [Kiritimatiellia bacterium]HPS07638.1 hypothetical protein [Kiritimatiellia bacterium]
MKSLLMVAMMAAVTFAFVGCKKEESIGDKMDKAVKSAEKSTDAAAKDAEKAGGDLQKKLDGALKK